jgi:hypothetical protein
MPSAKSISSGQTKNADQPFATNPNKELIRTTFDSPVIKEWSLRLGRPLKYLGLPAWQMLDIVAWQDLIGPFAGIERAENQQHLMFLNANIRNIEHRLQALYGTFDEILIRGRDKYQKTPDWPFDIVNLDYFGGFIYSDLSRPKAFRKLIANQASYEASFLLIVTQHLRDGDSQKEKDKFLSDLGIRLKGAVLEKRLHSQIDWIIAWYRDAAIPDAARQSLYMNFFFREFGEAEQFRVRCRPGVVYTGTGNTSMIHFVTNFDYQAGIAHRAASDQTLLEVVNLGLLEARNGKLSPTHLKQPTLSGRTARRSR